MSSLTRSGLLLALLSLASVAVGLVREGVTAYLFGTGSDYNAFVIAQTVPLAALNIFLGGAVVGAFIPSFMARRQASGDAEAWRYTVSIFALSTAAGVLVAAIIAAGAPWVVDGLGPGLDAPTRDAAIELTRLVIAALPFFVAGTVTAAVLNAHEEFRAPGARQVINNVAFILLVLAAGRTWGARALGWAFLMGAILQFLVQLPSLRRVAAGRLGRPRIARADLVDFFTRYAPILGIHLMLQGFTLLDRNFSTRAGANGAAVLAYAERLVNFARTVISGSLAIVIFPRLSKLTAEGGDPGPLVGRALGIVSLTTVPFALALMLHGDGFVALLYQRGSFSVADRAAVAQVLLWLAPSTVFFGAVFVFDRLFVARGQLWIYGALTGVGLVVNFIAKLMLTDRLGLPGVSIGTSLGSFVLVAAGVAYLTLRVGRGVLGAALHDFTAILFAFVISFGATELIARTTGALAAFAPYDGLAWTALAGLGGIGILHALHPPAYAMTLEKVRGRLAKGAP